MQNEGLDTNAASLHMQMPDADQCQFSDKLICFNNKLMELETKEQHLRTILGAQFNKGSFFLYRQKVINDAIDILHDNTEEVIAELSKSDTFERQESLEDLFLSSTENCCNENQILQ